MFQKFALAASLVTLAACSSMPGQSSSGSSAAGSSASGMPSPADSGTDSSGMHGSMPERAGSSGASGTSGTAGSSGSSDMTVPAEAPLPAGSPLGK